MIPKSISILMLIQTTGKAVLLPTVNDKIYCLALNVYCLSYTDIRYYTWKNIILSRMPILKNERFILKKM